MLFNCYFWRRLWGVDRDVWPQALQRLSGNSANGEQVFDSPEGSALFAEIDYRFCGRRSDAGYLLQFVRRRGVEIDLVCGWMLFLSMSGATKQKKQRRSGENKSKPCDAASRVQPDSLRGRLFLVAVRVVLGEFTEKRGLLADLGAVSDHYDLRVRGIEIFSRRENNVRSGERMNSGAVRLEMIFGQAI